MTIDRDLERALDEWLADGPMAASDRVLVTVSDRIARQRQRPAWRLRSWRDHPVSTPLRLAAALAAVIVIGVVGFSVLRPAGGSIGGPSPIPSPTPTPTSTSTPVPSVEASQSESALCAPADPACRGPLAAGRHSTNMLLIPLSFEVPEGWRKEFEVEGGLNLGWPTGPDDYINIWPDPVIANQQVCQRGVEPGLGRTVEDHVAWLTAHPGLTATTPEPASVGGLTGQTLDIQKEPDWTGECGDMVTLWAHQGTIEDAFWWDITDSPRLRLFILDAGDGHTVLIDIQAAEAADFDAFVAAATPVVESFEFGSAP